MCSTIAWLVWVFVCFGCWTLCYWYCQLFCEYCGPGVILYTLDHLPYKEGYYVLFREFGIKPIGSHANQAGIAQISVSSLSNARLRYSDQTAQLALR